MNDEKKDRGKWHNYILITAAVFLILNHFLQEEISWAFFDIGKLALGGFAIIYGITQLLRTH